MRWTIDSKASDGLKVIPSIPNISPCLVEGRNGIGKTVAIQLFQLISGEIPDDFGIRPSLWPSLRERLHETTVQVDDLKDGRSLRVTFSPDAWDETLPDSVGEWLGAAEIDGRSASIADCASLLSVTKIAGDEDLEDTLRRRVETLSVHLRTAARIVRDRGDQIDAALGDIRTDLERADPGEIAADASRLAGVEDDLKAAQAEAAAADRRLTKLLQAVETKRRHVAAGQEATELLARRTELVAKIERLDSELQTKELAAAAADNALSAEGDVQKKLSEAERLLRHRRSRLANLQREVEEAATRLSVDADAVSIAQAVTECEKHLEALGARHRELDATSRVRDLIGEIVLPLETAQADAGDQVLVKHDGHDLTVTETLAGVAERRQELANQPQPAQLRELSTLVDADTTRRDALREFASKLEQYELQRERVATAEDEAEQAAAQAEQASEAALASREANQAVGAAQEALTKAHAELATVQQRVGASGVASKEDAEADLQSALAELGLNESDLTSAEATARSALIEADRVLADATSSASAIRRRLTMRRTDIDLVIERLSESQRYEWLLRATPTLAAALADTDTRYEAFAGLRTAVLQASESAFAAADYLTSLLGIAEGFFKERDDDDLLQPLRPAFEVVLGQRLRETLNSPTIRRLLFDGSEVVGIEPSSRELTLRDESGAESPRPMEAFSTGERAFAFTQARIADLEPSGKPNRLLVLDEFGAFVAADRLPDLASFLATDVERVADQVLVILPLHVNYEAEIEDTRGQLRERYADRLAQITARDYCAVKLE